LAKPTLTRSRNAATYPAKSKGISRQVILANVACSNAWSCAASMPSSPGSRA